ncbi:MAG: peptidase [Oscillospiraceae bacterium]|jgi:HK97 family phage prohead protease|nr:peptidase [Oscillospiraceae bacterium]
MKKEAKADSAHICGYVNATEKKSKPVITPRGRVLEVIEPKAFERAIAKAYNITVNVDHDNSRIYASTKDGTLTVYEDAIGLYADVLITDKALINLALSGKIKGWSLGMRNVVDEIEPSASGLPVRHIKALDLDHITLLVDKLPAYSATSVEFRYSSKCEDPMMEYRKELQQIKQRKPKI